MFVDGDLEIAVLEVFELLLLAFCSFWVFWFLLFWFLFGFLGCEFWTGFGLFFLSWLLLFLFAFFASFFFGHRLIYKWQTLLTWLLYFNVLITLTLFQFKLFFFFILLLLLFLPLLLQLHNRRNPLIAILRHQPGLNQRVVPKMFLICEVQLNKMSLIIHVVEFYRCLEGCLLDFTSEWVELLGCDGFGGQLLDSYGQD